MPIEYQFSSAHFDLQTVLDLVKETIKEKRGNNNFILIDGILTAFKLTDVNDRMELRPQHELELISKNLGDIKGLFSFVKEMDSSKKPKFKLEEFPEPEQPVVEVKKPEENAEGGED